MRQQVVFLSAFLLLGTVSSDLSAGSCNFDENSAEPNFTPCGYIYPRKKFGSFVKKTAGFIRTFEDLKTVNKGQVVAPKDYPTGDHTTGTGGYMTVNTFLSPRIEQGTTFNLETPSLQSSTPFCLRFWYYSYKDGQFNVATRQDGKMKAVWEPPTQGWTDIRYVPWTQAEIDMSVQGQFQVIFEAVRKSFNPLLLAIDDVAFDNKPCNGTEESSNTNSVPMTSSQLTSITLKRTSILSSSSLSTTQATEIQTSTIAPASIPTTSPTTTPTTPLTTTSTTTPTITPKTTPTIMPTTTPTTTTMTMTPTTRPMTSTTMLPTTSTTTPTTTPTTTSTMIPKMTPTATPTSTPIITSATTRTNTPTITPSTTQTTTPTTAPTTAPTKIKPTRTTVTSQDITKTSAALHSTTSNVATTAKIQGSTARSSLASSSTASADSTMASRSTLSTTVDSTITASATSNISTSATTTTTNTTSTTAMPDFNLFSVFTCFNPCSYNCSELDFTSATNANVSETGLFIQGADQPGSIQTPILADQPYTVCFSFRYRITSDGLDARINLDSTETVDESRHIFIASDTTNGWVRESVNLKPIGANYRMVFEKHVFGNGNGSIFFDQFETRSGECPITTLPTTAEAPLTDLTCYFHAEFCGFTHNIDKQTDFTWHTYLLGGIHLSSVPGIGDGVECTGLTAHIQSPKFLFTGDACLSLNISSAVNLPVEIIQQNSNTTDFITTLTTNDTYQLISITLQFTGTTQIMVQSQCQQELVKSSSIITYFKLESEACANDTNLSPFNKTYEITTPTTTTLPTTTTVALATTSQRSVKPTSTSTKPSSTAATTKIRTTATTSNPLPTTANCTFENDTCAYKKNRDSTYLFSWMRTAATDDKLGPGMVSNTSGDEYYLIANGAKFSNEAILTSQKLASGAQCLQMSYYMAGADIEQTDLMLEIKSDKETYQIWQYSNSTGGVWRTVVVPFGADIDYQVVIRISKSLASLKDAVVAIDDILFPEICDSIPTTTPPTTTTTTPAKSRIPGDCSFDTAQDTCGYKSLNTTDFDWRLTDEASPSAFTGPNSDHTGGGYYLLMDSSTPAMESDLFQIISPYLSQTCSMCFSFYYSMYGNETGSLKVYLYRNGSTETVWMKSGEQGQNWLQGQFDISGDSVYRIIFEGVVGDGYRGDIGLDDFSIFDGPCNNSVIMHSTSCSSSSMTTTTTKPQTTSPLDASTTTAQTTITSTNGQQTTSNKRTSNSTNGEETTLTTTMSVIQTTDLPPSSTTRQVQSSTTSVMANQTTSEMISSTHADTTSVLVSNSTSFSNMASQRPTAIESTTTANGANVTHPSMKSDNATTPTNTSVPTAPDSTTTLITTSTKALVVIFDPGMLEECMESDDGCLTLTLGVVADSQGDSGKSYTIHLPNDDVSFKPQIRSPVLQSNEKPFCIGLTYNIDHPDINLDVMQQLDGMSQPQLLVRLNKTNDWKSVFARVEPTNQTYQIILEFVFLSINATQGEVQIKEYNFTSTSCLEQVQPSPRPSQPAEDNHLIAIVVPVVALSLAVIIIGVLLMMKRRRKGGMNLNDYIYDDSTPNVTTTTPNYENAAFNKNSYDL